MKRQTDAMAALKSIAGIRLDGEVDENNQEFDMTPDEAYAVLHDAVTTARAAIEEEREDD